MGSFSVEGFDKKTWIVVVLFLGVVFDLGVLLLFIFATFHLDGSGTRPDAFNFGQIFKRTGSGAGTPPAGWFFLLALSTILTSFISGMIVRFLKFTPVRAKFSRFFAVSAFSTSALTYLQFLTSAFMLCAAGNTAECYSFSFTTEAFLVNLLLITAVVHAVFLSTVMRWTLDDARLRELHAASKSLHLRSNNAFALTSTTILIFVWFNSMDGFFLIRHGIINTFAVVLPFLFTAPLVLYCTTNLFRDRVNDINVLHITFWRAIVFQWAGILFVAYNLFYECVDLRDACMFSNPIYTILQLALLIAQFIGSYFAWTAHKGKDSLIEKKIQ